ncbi:MAG TPA: SDR family oxidoreductase [Vicinamibacterales bacterium]|nr:SDR family oxidoreductase [Vicinamibacterales bacterium]
MTHKRLFSLDNKVAVIVGGGSGIGEAVTIACARQGARTVCLDVDLRAAEAAAERARAAGICEAGALDVRDGTAVRDAFEDIRRRLGTLDVVVSTPGVNVRKPILDYTDEEFDRVVTLNLKGSFHVLRAAGRLMVDQRRGSIILFSSIRAQVVEPGQSVYAATKAGILQLVRTAAAEFGPHGVRVNAIAPGVVETPLTAPIKANPAWYAAYAAKNALNRWATPEEMIGPAVFLASDASSYVTGTLLVADGGWTAIDGRFWPPGM